MNWGKIIEDAIEYIEGNITEDLTVGRILNITQKYGFRLKKNKSELKNSCYVRGSGNRLSFHTWRENGPLGIDKTNAAAYNVIAVT